MGGQSSRLYRVRFWQVARTYRENRENMDTEELEEAAPPPSEVKAGLTKQAIALFRLAEESTGAGSDLCYEAAEQVADKAEAVPDYALATQYEEPYADNKLALSDASHDALYEILEAVTRYGLGGGYGDHTAGELRGIAADLLR